MSPDQITILAVKNTKSVLVQEMEDLLWQDIISLENFGPDLKIKK
jgi:hypothetical protein